MKKLIIIPAILSVLTISCNNNRNEGNREGNRGPGETYHFKKDKDTASTGNNSH